jgi:alkylation response protein AidB-like acyl-CoA dehydrogenase
MIAQSVSQSATPAEETAFLDRVKRFVDEYVWPNTLAWEEDQLPADVFKRCAEVGLMQMTVPKTMGGHGYSCRAYAEACRLLATGDPALSMNVAAINALCTAHFVEFAHPEQREKYLPGCLSGDVQLAWGLTEPDAGSDARRVRTSAEPISDKPGFWKINGRKMFITNGGRAHLIIVIARTGEKDLSAFLVETGQPGFKLTGRIPTVGVRASWTAEFELVDAVGWHTPCTFEQAIGLLQRGRVGIAAMALGIAERAHELAVAYSKQREQFNRRLCDMQSVQNMIADSEMEIEAARLLVDKAARLYDEGGDVVKAASMAKLYASETANRVTNRAIQIHGGRGMVPEHRVEKLWRDAKLTEIGEGCSEIQRMIIAKQALR